jgi:hypothetical protein
MHDTMTRSGRRGYGVDVPFMLFQRRGRGIHVVSAERERAAGRGLFKDKDRLRYD